MAQREIVICPPVRTVIGTFGSALKDVLATERGAVADGAVILERI